MRLVMKPAKFLGRRLLVAAELDLGPERDLRDSQVARRILRQNADRLILVAVHRNRFLQAIARNVSMWQLERLATNASSGSTHDSLPR